MRAVPLTVLFAASSCITPPLVMSGGAREVELGPRRVEWGAERVEVELATHERLRGLFVPAGVDAPLVLHLLGSSGSVTIRQHSDGLDFDSDGLFAALRDRGYASLVLDYRGVGASDGERNPRHVPEDALAAWNEALRRVDGDPQRIVVRGMSLGTLAAASLLEHGVEPAAVVLIAPVRAETAAHNWLRHNRGAFLAWLASPFLAQPMDVDLLAAIDICRAPLTLVVGLRDELLPPHERAQLLQRARRHDAHVIELDLDHLHLVHAGYLPFEHEFVAASERR